jgi:hypothetical protein
VKMSYEQVHNYGVKFTWNTGSQGGEREKIVQLTSILP